MFLRSHSPSIYVHVRINFYRSHSESCRLEQQPRGRGYSSIRRNEAQSKVRFVLHNLEEQNAPITPLPIPLTTPPETTMYLVILADSSRVI